MTEEESASPTSWRCARPRRISPPASPSASRAFVEVQNGCDHRCTFCIIPYGRGNSRSVPAGLVVERIKALAGEGFGEVVLTGVDVTSYGPDLPGAPTPRPAGRAHPAPCARTCRGCASPRSTASRWTTGCSSSSPSEPRFMPHLHMSFQAGDDLVLKRMKRRHSRADAVDDGRAAEGEAARDRDRRRPHRRLPDRDARRWHENSLRLSTNATSSWATSSPSRRSAARPPRACRRSRRRRQGARPAAARGLRAAQGGVAGRAGRDAAAGAGRERRHGPCREFRAGPHRRHPRERGGPGAVESARRRTPPPSPLSRGMTERSSTCHHRRRRRHSRSECPRERGDLVRAHAPRLPQDLRPARRQSHRAVHQGGARRGDARRDRGGADRLRSRPAHRRQDPRAAAAERFERGLSEEAVREIVAAGAGEDPRAGRRSRSRSTPSRARR